MLYNQRIRVSKSFSCFHVNKGSSSLPRAMIDGTVEILRPRSDYRKSHSAAVFYVSRETTMRSFMMLLLTRATSVNLLLLGGEGIPSKIYGKYIEYIAQNSGSASRWI